jgi:hypothetical protein
MSTATAQTNTGSGAASAHDLFALTDDQILQIEPEAQDLETFAAERSDRMDPLREDLELLASDAPNLHANGATPSSNGKRSDDGLTAGARSANETTNILPLADSAASGSAAANGEAPQWLTERMNDPQHGADARALWDDVQSARNQASAFREVFAKPEDARVAAERARTLDEFDRAYFGAAGNAPEQTSASRTQLATKMLREDPAAFREMVFAGLRALEEAGKTGVHGPNAANAASTPQGQSSSALNTAPPHIQSAIQAGTPAAPLATQPPTQHATPSSQDAQHQQEARIAAYASFEKAANEDLERTVGGAISRALQEALPNAGKTENSASLKERLSGAIRQDVEKALQGDRALGEQVARILSGQRLDGAVRAQVVRLIGDRAQHLVPGAARHVLSDWTQTTLATHTNRADRAETLPRRDNAGADAPRATQHTNARTEPRPQTPRDAFTGRNARKIDYRRVTDDDILGA